MPAELLTSAESSRVEILSAEVSPWSRRQPLAAVKEEQPAESGISVMAPATANRRHPTEGHHFLPDSIFLRDLETDEPLDQPTHLTLAGTKHGVVCTYRT